VRYGAVQIAGVIDAEEADLLVECGADFLGFPLRLDFHPEDCSKEEAAGIIQTLPSPVTPVLITYLTDAGEIVRLASSLRVGWVQLHGAIEPDAVASVRAAAPELRLAKSLIVHGQDLDALEHALGRYARNVDAFLTDSFDPASGATGATGKVHDWAISRRLAERSPLPLVLAGGLTPQNVRQAIRTVRPSAVDVHTGVEGMDGRKCRDLVARFVAEARAGFAVLGPERTSRS
jgi:phosphoribosylanthranilate isomerase